MFKGGKKKDNLFPFLFDVSKYKKSQDSYTNYLKWDHAKQFEAYTTITSPLSFAALYNCRINTEELNDTCLVGKFHVYKKQTNPNNMQNSCYLVSASQFTNLFYLGGT